MPDTDVQILITDNSECSTNNVTAELDKTNKASRVSLHMLSLHKGIIEFRDRQINLPTAEHDGCGTSASLRLFLNSAYCPVFQGGVFT